MTVNTAIDETKHAFGLDGSKYWSSNGLANFKTLAQVTDPVVRFLAFRATISWGYIDSFFGYHWSEAKKVKQYRRPPTGFLPRGIVFRRYLPIG